MSVNSHDVQQLLRFELNYLEQGGYDRDRALLGTESPFRGTFSCINFGDQLQSHTCRECPLRQFVPEDKQAEDFPCHYISLSESGETVAKMIEKRDFVRMVSLLENWLRTTLKEMESTAEPNRNT